MNEQEIENRFWRILIGEMVRCIVGAENWRGTEAPNKEQLAHDFDMSLEGLAGYATRAFGVSREEVKALAKRIAPWNPASSQGLKELKERGMWE